MFDMNHMSGKSDSHKEVQGWWNTYMYIYVYLEFDENTIGAFGESTQNHAVNPKGSLFRHPYHDLWPIYFVVQKKKKGNHQHPPMQLGRKAYLSAPMGFLVCRQLRHFISEVYTAKRPLTRSLKIWTKKTHRNPILMISYSIFFLVILSWYSLM